MATSTYTDPGLRQLRAPARDAEDLAQVLADPGIGGFAVTTVIDQPSYQVRLAVEEFLNGRGTGDLLLVYLSCHGLLDARRRLYLAATDTRKDLLGSTGVDSAWVMDQLEHCRARRQVLIVDSCFSGAFAHGAKGEADLGLRDRFLGQGRGRAVLTASDAREYSFEGDPTDAAIRAGSVFTTALVQGLRTGAADTDHDGHVSVDDAYAYAFDQVQAAGAAQTPQRWLYGGEGQILLARSPAGPTIIPAPLPDSLRAGLDSPYPGIRVGAVTELGEWLTGGDPARAATARSHLQEVADTDIPRVAHTARALLDAGITPGPPTPERQVREDADRQARASAVADLERTRDEQARKAREDAARQAETSRRRDIAALQEQLRAMFAAGAFQDVVGIAGRLAELDAAAADPEGLTTQARRRLEQRSGHIASAGFTQAAGPGPDTGPGQYSSPPSDTATARIPRLAHTLTGHGGWRARLNTDLAGVYSVAFSPDGRLLASSGADKTVRLWDLTPADR